MPFSWAEILSQGIEVDAFGRWLVIAWCALLGGILGSFLNVVVYRMPRRMSLSYPGSRCPKCAHPIRWHDNVPVLGWLMLGGKCRDCGAPIAARYPLVEATVAAMSALIAWRVGFGETEPLPEEELYYRLEPLRYLFFMLPSCALLAAALIEYDGRRVPLRLLVVPLLVTIALTWWRPDLSLGSADAAFQGELFASGMTAGIVIELVLCMAGTQAIAIRCARGAAAGGANLRRVGMPAAVTISLAWLLVGRAWGDLALIVVAPFAMVLYALAQWCCQAWTTLGRWGSTGSLVLLLLAWLVMGDRIAMTVLSAAEGPARPLGALVAGAAFVLAGAILALPRTANLWKEKE